MISFDLVVIVGTQQFHNFSVIYQDIFSSRPLDLVVTGMEPLRWMINNTGTHHVQIDVGTAAEKMIPVFDGSCMITVFPKGSIAVLPLIELLAGPTGDQLHGFRNDITAAIVGHKQMDVVGSNHVIQNLQTIPFSRLIEPLKPSVPVF
jgi:hypothetical protein